MGVDTSAQSAANAFIDESWMVML